MLPLPRFDYEAPDTMADLLTLAAVPDSRLLAGGTDLMPSLKHRIFSPRTLVSLRRMTELRTLREEGGELSIGATVTLRELALHPLVRERYPALSEACAGVATRTIQMMGTIGGNLMLPSK